MSSYLIIRKEHLVNCNAAVNRLKNACTFIVSLATHNGTAHTKLVNYCTLAYFIDSPCPFLLLRTKTTTLVGYEQKLGRYIYFFRLLCQNWCSCFLLHLVKVKRRGFTMFEGVVAPCCNPLTLQPEQSGGRGSNPASTFECHDKGRGLD